MTIDPMVRPEENAVRPPPGPPPPLEARVWQQVATQIDGIGVGTSISALHRLGILERIGQQPGIGAGEIISQTPCRPGYLHVMLKLLACQGWLERTGAVGDGMRLRLTSAATGLPAHAGLYEPSRRCLETAHRLIDGGRLQDTDLAELLTRSANGWGAPLPFLVDLPELRLLTRIRCHLDGHLAAGILGTLANRGLLPAPGQAGQGLDLAALGAGPELEESLGRFFARLGWVEEHEGRFVWSAAGVIVALMTPQYGYPLTYLASLSRASELLTGELANLDLVDEQGDELHLDRALDIRFSGAVFSRTCREPFLELVLPVFHQPLAQQPRYLVDIGCGDGQVLAQTWQAVIERTPRGERLSEMPLIAVGADLQRIARDTTARLLAAQEIPHRTLAGDVGDPTGLREALEGLGITLADCLFLCKSVIHNRRYRPPRVSHPADDDGGDLVFVADDGGLIITVDVEQSLIELLRAWRPLAARHGWFVIEAHTVSADLAAAHLGRTQVTILDATHGFSRQLLLDIDRFRRAARRAGFQLTGGIDIGRKQVGHPVLSIDRLAASRE